jgi:hypothetical protein
MRLFSIFLFATCVFAQSASIRGVVTDESGAVVPGAKIAITGPNSFLKETASTVDGTYQITGLKPGDYTLQASAPDLILTQAPRLTLKTGTLTLNIQLKVATTVQQVTVQENTGPVVTPDPANNATALILRGEDLQALSDDPDDLANDLQALAGPAAGPNGGSIYIDGFSGGQIPSKESIREIRVNQNPFSPEYDKLGYGRVEIFTKPGTDKFHGTTYFNISDDIWNSRNPYAPTKAPFRLLEYGGNFGGPINSRSSFFVDVRRDSVNNGAIINAITLDPYTNIFLVPQRRLNFSPRLDYQLNANNTLVVRYGFLHTDIADAGLGGLNLVSRAYHAQADFNTVQATETAVIHGTIINETRFQFFRAAAGNAANSTGPSISVLGSFNGGASPVGRSSDNQNNYELQNYTSIVKKSHSWRFGLRLRGQTEASIAQQNFNGTFTFGGDQTMSSLDRYRLGIPTQFSITSGTPALSANQMDAGLFVGDDWRVRPNITLSLGLRYEVQTNLNDWTNIAPRVGIAWAPGAKSGKSRPKTVIRAGFGSFYDRFALANTLSALRYNGTLQQQFVVTDPNFYPNIPPIASLSGLQSRQSIQEIDRNLRAPYILQSAVSVERQLPKNTTVAVTYANSHGLHVLRSRDINAPLPGTYNPNLPGGGVYPLGTPSAVFLTESSGLYNQNQVIANVNSRVNANLSLFGNYMFNRSLSNTDGIGSYPGNPYNFAGEYGPASTDIHHRMTVGGSVNTRWNVRVSPFIILESGPPFDITTGRDLYGDTLFTSRPGIATDPNKPGVIATPYGLLDPNPTPDEKILGRNYGRGPGQIRVNFRVGKTFGFGPTREGPGGAPVQGPGMGPRMPGGVFGGGGGVFGGGSTNRRYNLSVSVSANNVINHTNPGAIIGNITSPFFGRANQAAGGGGGGGAGGQFGGGFSESANNRRLELQLRLVF